MVRMPKAVLMSGNHVCNNPRVIKEADSLAEHGFEVTVLGGWHDAALKRRDVEFVQNRPWRYEAVVDLTPGGTPRLIRHQRRVLSIAARIAHKTAGLDHPALLGYAHRALENAASKMPADIYIAHSEQALWAAQR